MDFVGSVFQTQNEPHAVLLYGHEGSEQRTVATELAQGFLCPHVSPSGACGACAVCEAFSADRCVDYQEVLPQPPSNIIRNDQIVTESTKGDSPNVPVREFFRVPPLMARNKVVVLVQPERMSREAASALLKTLEEPPAFAKLILCTSSISGVLPTIRSRCLSIACPTGTALADNGEGSHGFDEGTPGIRAQVETAPEAYEAMRAFCISLESASHASALKKAEEFREVVEKLERDLGLPPRAAAAEALRSLAVWSKKRWSPHKTLVVVESHRRSMGNVQLGLLTDAMFSALCSEVD